MKKTYTMGEYAKYKDKSQQYINKLVHKGKKIDGKQQTLRVINIFQNDLTKIRVRDCAFNNQFFK